MATVSRERDQGLITTLGGVAGRLLTALGDFTLFSARTVLWLVRRPPPPRVLVPICYAVGVRSVPVVAITGMFIGMVMAVQFFHSFAVVGLSTRLGSIINVSTVRELGPVLAATMLAGRVGSAMAAELATMRITEQVDALACLGAPPLAYLVAPRLVASVLLIPLLTVLADFMGIMGGAFICTNFYPVDSHFYWSNSQHFVGLWDIFTGLIKAFFFGTIIALISCHRGLHSQPGAEGVGQAATEAFVYSFIAILVIDFFLGVLLITIYNVFWPGAVKSFV
jgi:phospholipid/cholesterol/gamma-HCH transport system permease protein